MSSQPSERAAVVAAIDPETINDNSGDSDAVDMSKFHEAMFILSIGTTDITVDFKLQESDAAAGTYTDIAGKSITQLTGSDDNKQAVINLKSEELSAGKRYVRSRVTVGDGTAGAVVSVVGLGLNPRFGPASDDDLASVAQIVS